VARIDIDRLYHALSMLCERLASFRRIEMHFEEGRSLEVGVQMGRDRMWIHITFPSNASVDYEAIARELLMQTALAIVTRRAYTLIPILTLFSGLVFAFTMPPLNLLQAVIGVAALVLLFVAWYLTSRTRAMINELRSLETIDALEKRYPSIRASLQRLADLVKIVHYTVTKSMARQVVATALGIYMVEVSNRGNRTVAILTKL